MSEAYLKDIQEKIDKIIKLQEIIIGNQLEDDDWHKVFDNALLKLAEQINLISYRLEIK